MRRIILIGLVLLAPLTARAQSATEERGGVLRTDPYRWMENFDDSAVHAWIKAELQKTTAYLDAPLRVQLSKEFEEIYFPSTESLSRNLEQHFEDIQTQGRRHHFVPQQGNGIIDNQFDSPTQRYKVAMQSDSGSDLQRLTISDSSDSDTHRRLDDILMVKSADVIWEPGEKSFIYSSDRDGRLQGVLPIIRRHKIGTLQAVDEVLFEATRPDTWLSLMQIEQTLYLAQSTGMDVAIDTLNATTGKVTEVANLPGSNFSPIGYYAGQILGISLKGAPMGKIVGLDVQTGGVHDLVAGAPHAIDTALLFGSDLYVSYVVEAEDELYYTDLDAQKSKHDTVELQRVNLPGHGSIVFDSDDTDAVILYQSYTELTSSWRYDKGTSKLVPLHPADKSPMPLDAEVIHYTAHDGRQVPVWVIRAKTTELTPSTPCYLYGYGGFSINVLPTFRRGDVPWEKRGGCVAVATLPGGQEFGEKWHQDGALFNKRNVFDDFAAAAQALYRAGISSPNKMAINGASNGGLLVGATMNFYPELFRAAVPEVGVMELTRYQLFTGGKWWISEYGDRDNQAALDNLYANSPYHNLKRRTYPATLVITADADDRVVPLHSFKYLARLQDMKLGERAALLYVRPNGSHGWSAGGTRQSQLDYLSAKFGFLMQELGVAN